MSSGRSCGRRRPRPRRPARPASRAAASRHRCSIRPYAIDGQVLALALDVGLADRHLERLVGHLALDQPVRPLVLEEQHGVGVADRRAQHALRVVRRRRARPPSGRGRGRRTPRSTASGTARRARRRPTARGRPSAARSPRSIRYRIRAASETIWSNAGWMKSANWISATGSRPCSAIPIATPTIAGLGQRRVDDALLAELLQEPLRHPEHAAPGADVLAQDDDALVRRPSRPAACRGSP